MVIISQIETSNPSMIEQLLSRKRISTTFAAAAAANDDDRDRISLLPYKVLTRILSYLDTQTSLGTSVLSKRWNRLWRSSVPNFGMGVYYNTRAGNAIKDQVEIFTNVCNAIKNSSGTKTDGKHLCSWREIEKKLVEKKIPYHVRQRLKDQRIALMKKYKVWLRLVNDAPTSNESTFVHKKLTAVWWGNYLNRNPWARQFRSTPLECIEEMKVLFGDSLAEVTFQESEDADFGSKDSDDAGSDLPSGKNVDTDPSTHRTPEEATLPKDASPTKKRSMDFDDQLERILKTVKRSDETSLEECNKVLDGMKKLKMDSPLYIAACTIFCESQTHREQWMMLSKKPEEVRISWLRMIAKKLGIV